MFPGALESESPDFRILLVFWIQFLETGLFLSRTSRPKSLVLNSNEARYILCLLVGSLHQTNRSPASRSSSVNAWDVFRVENIALEGFYNEVQYEVLEVPGSICLFDAKHVPRVRSEEHTSELQSLTNLVCRLPSRSTLFPYTTLFRSILCLLVGSLHQTNRSPASRSSSVNAWDVFRVENLALEGFSNEVQYEVLEVPGSICLFDAKHVPRV